MVCATSCTHTAMSSSASSAAGAAAPTEFGADAVLSCLMYFAVGDPKAFGAFRFPELDSMLKLFVGPHANANGEMYRWQDVEENTQSAPFLEVKLPSAEVAARMASRMMMLKWVGQLFAEGSSLEELVENLLRVPDEQVDELSCAESFSVGIVSHGKRYSYSEHEAMRAACTPFFSRFAGRVQIKGAAREWLICVDCRSPENIRWYVVRVISHSVRIPLLAQYTLKKREYLGPTSTDAELAFLMANQTLAKTGSRVFDPFVGTGSLLIACAHFGASVTGTDLDWRVLHGMKRGVMQGQNTFDNFRSYGLPLPELLCADNSIPVWRDSVRFDGIVCDPPYGVRAGAKKLGTANPVSEIPERYLSDHTPRTQQYEVHNVLQDLLCVAAKHLEIGGRLVYLLPTTDQFVRETDLMRHECLEVVDCTEQALRRGFARQCVTMVKVQEPPAAGDGDDKYQQIILPKRDVCHEMRKVLELHATSGSSIQQRKQKRKGKEKGSRSVPRKGANGQDQQRSETRQEAQGASEEGDDATANSTSPERIESLKKKKVE